MPIRCERGLSYGEVFKDITPAERRMLRTLVLQHRQLEAYLAQSQGRYSKTGFQEFLGSARCRAV